MMVINNSGRGNKPPTSQSRVFAKLAAGMNDKSQDMGSGAVGNRLTTPTPENDKSMRSSSVFGYQVKEENPMQKVDTYLMIFGKKGSDQQSTEHKDNEESKKDPNAIYMSSSQDSQSMRQLNKRLQHKLQADQR